MRGMFAVPSPVILGLIALNIAVYVMEMVLLRGGSELPQLLMLTPADVVGELRIWQPVTSLLIHSPSTASHVLMNALTLWIFGPLFAATWDSRGILVRYAVFGVAGSLFAIVLGALSFIPALRELFEPLWRDQVYGSTGAILGLLVAWGVHHRKTVLNLLFLGEIRGGTLAALTVGVELLHALSYGNANWTSTIGGVLMGGFVAVDAWSPAAIRALFRRNKLRMERRAIERRLSKFQVIEGGRKEKATKAAPPRKDDWVH